MLEPPDLAEAQLQTALEKQYSLDIHALRFLPIGSDHRAWAFRVDCRQGGYFLKLRRGEPRPATLSLARALRQAGMREVVAPIPTRHGRLCVRLGEYHIILYPFIAGRSAWGMPLSAAQWHGLGGSLHSLHRQRLPADLRACLPRERYGQRWIAALQAIEASLAYATQRGPLAAAFAAHWRAQAQVIAACRARYVQLGAELAKKPPPALPCHADIHSANIIIDDQGALHIVDWDEVLLAPKERDLMFFVENGLVAAEQEAFFAGYGLAQVDWLALAYYKYDWVLQEFADFGERIFHSEQLGAQDLQASLDGFLQLFRQDDVIARARRADARARRWSAP